MHARVSRVTLQPGKIDDAMAVLHNHGLATLQQAQGFAGGLWLYDPETLRGLQVVLWENEADFERLVSTGAGQETNQMLRPLMVEMSPPQTFVVPHRERVPNTAKPTHAVVVAPSPRPGTEEEAMDVWRAAVLPVLQQQHGYAGSAVLVDQAAAQVLDVTLWASEAALQTAMQSAEIRNATGQMLPFMAGEPAVHAYEVRHLE